MSLSNHVDASGNGRPLPPVATPRSRSLGQTDEERQRFVARVLDLMQVAEAGLLVPNDPQAVNEALRAISAVKAIASFLNHTLVANEATLIIQHSESMGIPGESDRGWLLVAIDRLRLLAVDPHHSSTPKSLVIPVSMAYIDRLNTVIMDLSTRLSPHPDNQVQALLAELLTSGKMLLRAPVAPLVSRLQAHALRLSHVLASRGDDLAIESRHLNLLEKITPPLITAAVKEAGCANELTLLFVEQEHDYIVRLACGCTVPIPALITKELLSAGSITQDDGIITIRLAL